MGRIQGKGQVGRCSLREGGGRGKCICRWRMRPREYAKEEVKDEELDLMRGESNRGFLERPQEAVGRISNTFANQLLLAPIAGQFHWTLLLCCNLVVTHLPSLQDIHKHTHALFRRILCHMDPLLGIAPCLSCSPFSNDEIFAAHLIR